LTAGRHLDKRDQSDDIAEMRHQVSPILDAVKSTVPQEVGGVIFEKLDQVEQRALGLDGETDYFEEFFDPGDCGDVDDAM